MSTYKDRQVAWIDFFRGKRHHIEGVDTAPIYEGRIKLLEDVKKGEEVRFAVWEKTKEGVTGGSMFSGKVIKTVQE